MIVQEDVIDAIPETKGKSGYVRILLFLTFAVFMPDPIVAVAADTGAQKFTIHLSDYRFHPDPNQNKLAPALPATGPW